MQLNNFSFIGNYVITRITYDSSPVQELNLMKLDRKDGAKFVSSNFAPKDISISGMIKGVNREDLEKNLTLFKEHVMITNGNLDVDYAGAYRRYKVNCLAMFRQMKQRCERNHNQ